MNGANIDKKLENFTSMVLKDAAHKAGLLIHESKMEMQQMMEEKEISFLKEAYLCIQQALGQIEKERNEALSSKMLEVRQLWYKKRMEITDRVFEKVSEKLALYRSTPEYGSLLRNFVYHGKDALGQGVIKVFVESVDLSLAEEIARDCQDALIVAESEELLFGGCILVNKTRGILLDCSFKKRLLEQREEYLEYSGMNIDV